MFFCLEKNEFMRENFSYALEDTSNAYIALQLSLVEFIQAEHVDDVDFASIV